MIKKSNNNDWKFLNRCSWKYKKNYWICPEWNVYKISNVNFTRQLQYLTSVEIKQRKTFWYESTNWEAQKIFPELIIWFSRERSSLLKMVESNDERQN